VLTSVVYEAVRLLRLPALLRRWTEGAVILCYHNVIPPEALAGRDAALHMERDVFERQLAWLRRHFDLVSLEVLLDRLRSGVSLRGLMCLTFDDGYVGFFRWALPALRAQKVPAAVFLVADAADRPAAFWWDQPALAARATDERRARWLAECQGDGGRIALMEGVPADSVAPSDLMPASWEMIRSHAAPDLTFGAHTSSHRALPTLDASDLANELDDCARRIGIQTGTRPRALAYPYGAWNPAVRDAARAAGYEVGLTLNAGRVRARDRDELALRRINVPGRISPAAFEAWASGLLLPALRGRGR